MKQSAENMDCFAGSAQAGTFASHSVHTCITNHLGNVLTTISDHKLPFDNSNDNIVDGFLADITSAQDYYPFGMIMPERQWNTTSYRFGFNGKENDNEVKGIGNQQDYGMRIYDPRLGRFLSVDPLAASFPWYTPYQFAGNKPIWKIDLDGAEEDNSDANQEQSYKAPDGNTFTASNITNPFYATKTKSPTDKVLDDGSKYYADTRIGSLLCFTSEGVRYKAKWKGTQFVGYFDKGLNQYEANSGDADDSQPSIDVRMESFDIVNGALTGILYIYGDNDVLWNNKQFMIIAPLTGGGTDQLPNLSLNFSGTLKGKLYYNKNDDNFEELLQGVNINFSDVNFGIKNVTSVGSITIRVTKDYETIMYMQAYSGSVGIGVPIPAGGNVYTTGNTNFTTLTYPNSDDSVRVGLKR